MDSDATERLRRRTDPAGMADAPGMGAGPEPAAEAAPEGAAPQTKLTSDRPPGEPPLGRTYGGFSASAEDGRVGAARLHAARRARRRWTLLAAGALVLLGAAAGLVWGQAPPRFEHGPPKTPGPAPAGAAIARLADLPVAAPPAPPAPIPITTPPVASGPAAPVAPDLRVGRHCRCAGRLRAPARAAHKDTTVARLDRRLDRALIGAARAGVPGARLHAEQARWVRHRNAAARRSPVALTACYERRIAELDARARTARLAHHKSRAAARARLAKSKRAPRWERAPPF